MRLFTIFLLLASVLMVANLVQVKPIENNQLSVYVFLYYEYLFSNYLFSSLIVFVRSF